MRLLLVLLGAVLLLAACGSDDGTEGAGPSTAPPAQVRSEDDQPGMETEPDAPSADDEAGDPEPATEAEAPAEAGESPQLVLVEVVSGLEAPVHLAAAASEPNRLYIVEQGGRIRVVENGRLMDDPFLDIGDLVLAGGEQGLLSVAFHPDYEVNGFFYVNYTDLAGNTKVVEYRTSEGAVIDGSARTVFAIEQPFANHNGGQLAFGPDGLLYIGTGDGGAAGDRLEAAQDLTNLLGKLLRIDVADPNASVTVDAYGLRNPWRFSFDRATGDLYIGDVGQNRWEEIDYLPNSRTNLSNLGWDVFEGNEVFEDEEANPEGELVQPVAVYGHDEGCSVTGGFVYRGSVIPGIDGRYFYGDFCSGAVWSLRVESGEAVDLRREDLQVSGLSSFGEDAAGELYLLSLDGTAYRLAVSSG